MAEEARRTLKRAVVAFSLALAAFAAAAADPQKTRPAWAELTADQQQVLDPLKADWDALSASRRKSWIGIANRYPSMTPQEQQRVQHRMRKWTKLTPEQRQAARERYKSMGKLSAEKRQTLKQQWAEYQALPPGEKRMLDAPAAPAERRSAKPRAATPAQSPTPKPAPPAK